MALSEISMEDKQEGPFFEFDKNDSKIEILKYNDSHESDKAEDPKETIKELTKEYVLALVNSLKSTSYREVHKALNRIRSRVIQTDAGISLLKECKGFKILVRFLTVKDEEMLNVSLSILGNCCSKLVGDQDLREEVLLYNIAALAVGVLKRTNSEGVLKRACRLVGNLAQARNLALQLHQAAVAPALLQALSTTESAQVKQMAVRALRWVWETDKYHGEMLKAEAVKSVASHLTTDNKELLHVVLRALVVFTQTSVCPSKIAQQIAGDGGNGYSQLVKLMEEQVTSVVVCNLSHSPLARVELAKAGVVPAIIDKLKGGTVINSYLITALCVMCCESMVRASLRGEPRGFTTLLSLLGNSKAKPFHGEILAAITQFHYDQQSLMMMVSGGLIGLLVSKLGEMSGEAHEEEREGSWGGGSGGSSGGESPGGWSPPPCSPPSPSSSLQYSPSCSPTYLPPGDPDPLTPPSKQNDKWSWVGLEKAVGEDGFILEVLSHLTYQNIPLRPLAAKATITTFLHYLATISYPRSAHNYIKASKILGSIVSCKHYYNFLVEDESILEVHRELCRPRHEECSWCNRLKATGKWVLGEARLAAQSGLGEGEMSHRLAAAPHPTTALTIPHVVKHPKLLCKLLFGHKGFQCLIDCLDTRIEEAVPSLHELFTTLGINNPQKHMETCTSCDIGSARKEANVTFRLDDGSTVGANREALAHSCPMFEAMFRGGFREAAQTTIRLTDITSDCLAHLTRLADEYCSCCLPKELSTLLEMVSVTDRFLLPELTEKTLEFVMNRALTASTAPQIYDWGLKISQSLSNTASVPEDVVRYLLTANMLHRDRVQATQFIIQSENRSRFVQDVSDTVVLGLREYLKTFRYYPSTSSEQY